MDILRQFYSDEGPERCGLILIGDEIIETVNSATGPEAAFEIPAEDLITHEDRTIASWHTLSKCHGTAFLRRPRGVPEVARPQTLYRRQGWCRLLRREECSCRNRWLRLASSFMVISASLLRRALKNTPVKSPLRMSPKFSRLSEFFDVARSRSEARTCVEKFQPDFSVLISGG